LSDTSRLVFLNLTGLGSFYTELMRGIGASSRLWDLIDRQPSIPLTGKLLGHTG